MTFASCLYEHQYTRGMCTPCVHRGINLDLCCILTPDTWLVKKKKVGFWVQAPHWSRHYTFQSQGTSQNQKDNDFCCCCCCCSLFLKLNVHMFVFPPFLFLIFFFLFESWTKDMVPIYDSTDLLDLAALWLFTLDSAGRFFCLSVSSSLNGDFLKKKTCFAGFW